MPKSEVIIISGPTATGKTTLGISLAKYLIKNKNLKASILNFDSLLFYDELTIGTSRPSISEMQGIDHYLIGTTSIKKPINAADFVNMANPLIKHLHEKGHIIFLVGGSGFYLRALLHGMYPSRPISPEIQKQSEDLYQQEGIRPFLYELKKIDEETFNRLHPNDHYRIRRAVEHYWENNSKFSMAKKNLEERANYEGQACHLNSIHHIYLNIPKEDHYPIIESRTNHMIKNGLENEVKNLLNKGFSGQERPLQSIGYKEMVEYLLNKSITLDDCIKRIIISTRQLAKAQRTWFKRISPKIEYNPLSDQEKIIVDLKNFLQF